MSVPDLLLDPNLRYWVLLPISFVMVAVGILRNQIMIILQTAPKSQPLNKLRESEHIRKAQLLKQNNCNLPKKGFEARQLFLTEKLTNGSLLAEKIEEEKQTNPFTDPGAADSMMAVMKNSFGGFIMQTAMMAWVNFFFAGFVLMKLPFPLTLRFKQMLQSGVATSDLDVRWVSSISWYFISVLGLNSIYNLLLDDPNMGSQMLQQQQALQPQMPGGPTPDKIMLAEANDLRIISHEYILNTVESRILGLYS